MMTSFFRTVVFPAASVSVVGILSAGVGAPPPSQTAPAPIDAAALYQSKCAGCHESGDAGSRAPARDALGQRSPEAIVAALTGGAMRYQGLSLSGGERRAIAEFLSGRALGGDPTGAANARCAAAAPLRDPLTAPGWNGWSPTLANTGFQPADRAGLSAADVPKLTLKWAFGYPDTTSGWGKPTVVGGRLFVGGQNGTVYSLDARTGCVAWTYTAEGGVRTAISVGPRAGGGYNAYFSDQRGFGYAVDAQTGREIWKKQVDSHPLIRLTGSPVLYDGRLYVPTSSYEESGKSPDYNCCTFRGSIVALDAGTGAEIWRAYTVTAEPKLMGRRDDGVEAWGPAGGAIWSAPTIDVKRGAIYVGVGNTYSGTTQPATDAVAAFDLKTGNMLWAQQVTPDDVFGCRRGEANCGERSGPDFDFGTSPALVSLPGGRDLIVIGQKSGVAYAMDPDRQGAVVWQYRAGEGGALGGIEWGIAVDADQAYLPIADANRPQPGGLHAVKIATGERVWFTPAPPPVCERGRGCNGAQSAAVTAIPGVVFSGSFDGALRAYSTKDGAIIWTFDTNRDFATLNGVPARGGSINGPSPTIVDGMVYVNSGYSAFGTRPGNVLLAFEVPSSRAASAGAVRD